LCEKIATAISSIVAVYFNALFFKVLLICDSVIYKNNQIIPLQISIQCPIIIANATKDG
jgi:hypothetical protein